MFIYIFLILNLMVTSGTKNKLRRKFSLILNVLHVVAHESRSVWVVLSFGPFAEGWNFIFKFCRYENGGWTDFVYFKWVRTKKEKQKSFESCESWF